MAKHWCTQHQNYELLTIGSSKAEAVVLTDTIEEMAEVQLIFLSGGKINLPSGFGAQRTRDN